jgi:hypothetical protein
MKLKDMVELAATTMAGSSSVSDADLRLLDQERRSLI